MAKIVTCIHFYQDLFLLITCVRSKSSMWYSKTVYQSIMFIVYLMKLARYLAQKLSMESAHYCQPFPNTFSEKTNKTISIKYVLHCCQWWNNLVHVHVKICKKYNYMSCIMCTHTGLFHFIVRQIHNAKCIIMRIALYSIQWNLFITRSLGPRKPPRYTRPPITPGQKKTKKPREPGPAKPPRHKRILLPSDLVITRLHCILYHMYFDLINTCTC